MLFHEVLFQLAMDIVERCFNIKSLIREVRLLRIVVIDDVKELVRRLDTDLDLLEYCCDLFVPIAIDQVHLVTGESSDFIHRRT